MDGSEQHGDLGSGATQAARDMAHFDQIAQFFIRKDQLPSSRTARHHRLRTTLATVALPPDIDIFEAGCGAGFAADYLRGRYRTFLGIDHSRRLIELARRNNSFQGAAFEVADINDFSASKEFDVVVMIGVLHHLEDMNSAIGRIHALLKPGGWFLVNEPQPTNPIVSMFRRIRKRLDRTYSADQRELTAREISEAMQRGRFANITVRPQGLFSTPFAEVPLRPQWLMSPLSMLSCRLDSILERTLGRLVSPLTWNVIVAARRPSPTEESPVAQLEMRSQP